MDKFTDTITYTYIALKSIFADMTLKLIFAIAYVMYAFLFDVTQAHALLAIIVLVLLDFATGISAAKVSGEEIKSSKVFRSAVKVVMYMTLISASHLLEVASVIGFADDTVIAFLAATELISLIENVGRMGFAVPKKLLNKLQHFRDDQ